jgi:hypothetical protein
VAKTIHDVIQNGGKCTYDFKVRIIFTKKAIEMSVRCETYRVDVDVDVDAGHETGDSHCVENARDVSSSESGSYLLTMFELKKIEAVLSRDI